MRSYQFRSFRCRLACLFMVMLTGIFVGCNRAESDQDIIDALPTSTPLPVHAYESEGAFDLLYPSTWDYSLLGPGLLLFGEAGTINEQLPGATLSVFRVQPEAVRGDLGATFEHYLDNGPIEGGYETLTEVELTELGGKEALAMTLQKAEEAESPAIKTFITSAQTDSGAIYILSATAPLADWNQDWPLFQIVMQSLEFNE